MMFEFALKNNPDNIFAVEELENINSFSQTENELSEEDDSEKIKENLNQILDSVYELFQYKKYDEALSALINTEQIFYSQIESEKDLISAYENLKGLVLLALKKTVEAKEAFELALNINPQSSQACAGLGEVLYLSGKDDEAKTMYEWGVINNSDNQFAVEGLSKVNKVLGFSEEHNSISISV